MIPDVPPWGLAGPLRGDAAGPGKARSSTPRLEDEIINPRRLDGPDLPAQAGTGP